MKIEISYKNSLIGSLSAGESLALHLNGSKLTEDLIVRAVREAVELPSLSAPTISLEGSTLTITDTSGVATSFDILVDGEVKHTLAKDTKYLYNGVKLPKIPEDVLADYPYCWIRNNTRTGYYDLLFSKNAWYLKDENTLAKSTTDTMWYQIAIASADTATEWVFNQTYSSLTWGNESDRRIMWSNYDIPNGSATATDIYFEGTETIQGTVFDLSSLITDSGTYNITVRAKADGYADSEPSNAVEYYRAADLTGTTWYVPKGWTCSQKQGEFILNGSLEYRGNNYSFTWFGLGWRHLTNGGGSWMANSIMINNPEYLPIENKYPLTIQIADGTDVTNPELIAWLSQYGELQ